MAKYVTDGLQLCLIANVADNDLTPHTSSDDDKATWFDVSGNDRDATIYNSDWDSTSGWAGSGTASDPYAWHNEYNASNADYLGISYSSWMNGDSRALSFEFWFKQDSTPQTYLTLAQHTDGSSTGYRMGMRSGDSGKAGKLWFSTFGSYGSNTIYGNDNIDAESGWLHIVFTCDSSGNKKIYLNGTLQTETSTDEWDLDTSNGLELLGRPSSIRSVDGKCSVIRMYNKALSSTEVTQNYNAGMGYTWSSSSSISAQSSCTVNSIQKHSVSASLISNSSCTVKAGNIQQLSIVAPYFNIATDGLIVHFHSGNQGANPDVWTDMIGTKNMALYNFLHDTDDGWKGNNSSGDPSYLKFNASHSNYGTIASTALLNTPSFTYEVWARQSTRANYTSFIRKGANSVHLRYYNYLTPPTLTYYNGSGYEHIYADELLTVNEFVHIVGTYDGTTSKLYINGVLQENTSNVAYVNTQDTLYIAFYSTGNYVNVDINSIRIYDNALSDSDVLKNYNNSLIYTSEKRDIKATSSVSANATVIRNGVAEILVSSSLYASCDVFSPVIQISGEITASSNVSSNIHRTVSLIGSVGVISSSSANASRTIQISCDGVSNSYLTGAIINKKTVDADILVNSILNANGGLFGDVNETVDIVAHSTIVARCRIPIDYRHYIKKLILLDMI